MSYGKHRGDLSADRTEPDVRHFFHPHFPANCLFCNIRSRELNRIDQPDPECTLTEPAQRKATAAATEHMTEAALEAWWLVVHGVRPVQVRPLLQPGTAFNNPGSRHRP